MKLVHCDLESCICDEWTATEWILESPEIFSYYVQELHTQCEGGEGRFVLSQGDKELNISKSTELICDVMGLDVNNRKILGKLYSDLQEVAFSEELFVATQSMTQEVKQHILCMEDATNYILDMDEQIDMSTFFKALGVRFYEVEENFFERLVRYIKVEAELLERKFFIFINLRSYLTDSQIVDLIQEAGYQEIQILMIEHQAKSCIKGVKRCIIDKDRCEI